MEYDSDLVEGVSGELLQPGSDGVQGTLYILDMKHVQMIFQAMAQLSNYNEYWPLFNRAQKEDKLTLADYAQAIGRDLFVLVD